MSNALFYTIGISFMGGIFLRSFLNLDTYAIIAIFFVGCALLFGVLWILKKKTSPILLIGLACVSVSLGMVRLHVEETKVSALVHHEGQEVELTGRIVREPEERENTMHFYIEPFGEERLVGERVLVTTEKFGVLSQDISYGDTIRAFGTLKKPEAFASDGGRMFDYGGYLKTRGVNYLMQYADVSLKAEGAPTFLFRIYSGKSRFESALELAVPMPHAGLGEGLLLGVKRALGTELEETFRKTGIIHIVVLSGYNVMIVVTAMMYMLAFVFLPRTRMIIGLGAIFLFVLLVGPSATVLRASIMASLLLVAKATGRVYAILRALLLAGVIMLLVNPYLLVHDPGFQLSFLATLALILLAPYGEKKLSFLPEAFGVRTIVTATIVTQFFVLPLLLYHTGLLSFVSVIVNALVLPMVPVAMLLTFLTGMIGMFIPALGLLIGFLAYGSLGYIIVISEFFGALPLAATTVIKFPAWIMFASYAGIALWMSHILNPKKEKTTHPLMTQREYADWTIEEETDNQKTGDAQRASPSSPLPFR